MRLKNSIRNLIASLFSQFVLIVLTFLTRKIFANLLGAELLGVNSLFLNILTVLSLTELGIGSVMIVHLYEPINKNNIARIKSLMKMYKRAYWIIGIITFGLGIILMPFLPYIVEMNSSKVVNLYIIFFMFLINNVSTYFFAYKKSILTAGQKNYIITYIHLIIYISMNILQILILKITHNYYLYLGIQIICNITENVIISIFVNRKYPYLKEKSEELPKQERKNIIRDVKAMLVHKIGGIVTNSTDNIIISSFLGVYWVGLYSNYYLIMSTLSTLLNHFYDAVVASVGDLNTEDNPVKMYSIYKKVSFFTFWIYSFCTLGIITLSTPFIKLVFGQEYVMTSGIVICIAMVFFTTGIRKPSLLFKDSTGLFIYDKYKSLISCVVNLVLSIILVQAIGIIGVIIGTIISTVGICWIWEVIIIYKHLFQKKLKEYFKIWGKYLIIFFVLMVILILFTNYNLDNTLIELITKAFIILIVPNIIIYVLYRKSSEFKYFSEIIKSFKNKILLKTKK